MAIIRRGALRANGFSQLSSSGRVSVRTSWHVQLEWSAHELGPASLEEREFAWLWRSLVVSCRNWVDACLREQTPSRQQRQQQMSSSSGIGLFMRHGMRARASLSRTQPTQWLWSVPGRDAAQTSQEGAAFMRAARQTHSTSSKPPRAALWPMPNSAGERCDGCTSHFHLCQVES